MVLWCLALLLRACGGCPTPQKSPRRPHHSSRSSFQWAPSKESKFSLQTFSLAERSDETGTEGTFGPPEGYTYWKKLPPKTEGLPNLRDESIQQWRPALDQVLTQLTSAWLQKHSKCHLSAGFCLRKKCKPSGIDTFVPSGFISSSKETEKSNLVPGQSF